MTASIMMTTPLDLSHQRALGDLLQAERDLRQKNEGALRELRQVLLDTAIRLDGERLESLRRENPSVPDIWSAADWRKFFSSAPRLNGWGSVVQQDVRAQRELMQQIEGLKASLMLVESQLETERSKQPMAALNESRTAAPALDLAALPDGATPSAAALVEDTQKAMQLFPKKIPAAFSNVLNGGGRVGGDLLRVFRRYFIALYLIGRWRLSAALEIEEILAGADGVSAGSGSLRRVFDDLGRAAIILSETLTLDSPHTTLKLYRLSPNGEKLYQALFGKRPYENEWSRLIRLREGAQFPDHTMAVIAFAMHARKRGYAAQVLPEADNLKTLPHIWVAREDEKFYVEVEQEGGQERASRWHSIAALNGGRLALCAATQKSRARLACDCKLEKLPGLAADLESLVGIKFKEISQKTPLWLESW